MLQSTDRFSSSNARCYDLKIEEVKIHNPCQPTTKEIDAAVAVCMAAFPEDDVGTRNFFGDCQALREPYFRAALAAETANGRLFLASHNKSGTIGMLLCCPPGQGPFVNTRNKQQKPASSDFIHQLPDEYAEWIKNTWIPVANKLFEESLGQNGRQNSWYIHRLAVDPKFQRRGIANLLMNCVCEQARGSILSVGTTNDLNVEIYRKLGFDAKAQTIVQGPAGSFTAAVTKNSLQYQAKCSGVQEGQESSNTEELYGTGAK